MCSDLHAHTKPASERAPSHLDANAAESPTRHPITALKDLVSHGLKADLLLCPGDLGDKADAGAIRYSWKALHEIARALGARRVICTAGNHDLQSRDEAMAKVEAAPQDVLKGLEPWYPAGDRTTHQQYWSDSYSIIDDGDCRIVTLNSSALHGYGPGEYDHGRVTARTRDQLRHDLEQLDPKPLNILLCHHHVIEFAEIDSSDYSKMVGGELLLQLLDRAGFGHWLILHGHKHLAQLAYAPGSSSSPVIFAAGSFSVDLSLLQQTWSRNQFYVVDVPLERARTLALPLAATFRSWRWLPTEGWTPSDEGRGLPARGGFGFRANEPSIVRVVEETFAKLDLPELSWDQLTGTRPELQFLTPADLARGFRALDRAGYAVDRDADGRYREITPPHGAA